MSRNPRGQKPATTQEDRRPRVGIIFLVGDRLFTESAPTAEGEVYGDHINYQPGHDEFWARLQTDGRVPCDEEYFGVPRGRAVFSRRTGQYFLYLDRCIIKKPGIVRAIRRRLNLPSSAEILPDAHCRCPTCLYKSSL